MSTAVENADLAAYLAYLRAHGAQFDVSPALRRDRDHTERTLAPCKDKWADIDWDGLPHIRERRDPAAGFVADHATEMIARCYTNPAVFEPGCRVWDVGCGTGVLGVLALVMGAKEALGTDISLDALELADATAGAAGVAFPMYVGSVLDAVPVECAADLVTANLPHKPCPQDRMLQVSQNGGPEGDEPHALLAAQASERLSPGARVLFFLHSLPHPRLLGHYQASFDLTLLAWKYRFLGDGEYGALEEVFAKRCSEGRSFIVERDGRRALIACAWMARRK